DILIERFEVIACSKCSQPIDVAASDPFTAIHCPVCGAEMRVPARFANFILLSQLGKGGMGAVYKAYDETLGRTVALKVMQQSIGQDRAFVEQFLQEARALAAINHPHIVQIYSYGEDNGQPYIVMELVDGNRLDHLQEKHKALDEAFVLQTAIQVIQGLQAANAAGMTHGDIKPANILYDKSNSAKVADFGLARFKGEKPKPGEVWGTPYYVAPEVVKGQAPNAGSDIYSLGGTLYHVLTGEPPFNCETVTDTVLLRFKEPAPDPRVFKNSVTPKTAAILLRMLEMDPFARYPTYESLLKDVTVAIEPLLEARSGKKKPPEKKSIVAPVMLGLVALALIAGLSFLGYHVFQAKQAEKRVQAQRAADIAAGRLKQVMRGGQLVWVRVEADKPADEAAAASPASEWTLVAGQDDAVAGNNAAAEFKDQTFLALRAGNAGDLEDASKIYLRFSLAGVDRARIGEAVLRLTARKTGAKPKTPPYQLQIWALKAPQPWDLQFTWNTAPGNDPATPGGMNAAQADLLATVALAPNPDTGDPLTFDPPELAAFLRTYAPDELTLVLTGDGDTDHKTGWKFTATEDAERFRPPTLLLKAK
ncbi:MAG: protein kinase, partial [Kiritimatiellia bacterium]